jgi:hypothetical protein
MPLPNCLRLKNRYIPVIPGLFLKEAWEEVWVWAEAGDWEEAPVTAEVEEEAEAEEGDRYPFKKNEYKRKLSKDKKRNPRSRNSDCSR